MAVTGIRHTKEQREFIVRRLAQFETPRDICLAFVASFPDVKCAEQDVIASDPRISVVPFDLFTLFRSETAAYLAQDPLFADQRARIHAMSKQAEFAIARGAPAESRTIFRQIAEELGVVAGKGGAKAALAPGKDAEPIAEIRVTYVDPKPPEPAAS
jgi:hypothetical protein